MACKTLCHSSKDRLSKPFWDGNSIFFAWQNISFLFVTFLFENLAGVSIVSSQHVMSSGTWLKSLKCARVYIWWSMLWRKKRIVLLNERKRHSKIISLEIYFWTVKRFLWNVAVQIDEQRRRMSIVDLFLKLLMNGIQPLCLLLSFIRKED